MPIKNLSFTFLSFIGLLFLGPQAYSKQTNILFIGDSITQGGKKAEEYTYRYELFKLLTDKQICFDFIGTRNHAHKTGFEWPQYKALEFDKDHQGYYGIKTNELYEQIKRLKDNFGKPDISLIHIGTNDRKSTDLHNDVEIPLGKLIRILVEMNPDSLILVSLLNQNYGNIQKVRTAIENTIAKAKSEQLNVFAVKHYVGWNERPGMTNSDTLDWVHPNINGQKKMAQLWFEEMSTHNVFEQHCAN
ncbi:GDSL-type esterase/lipase family protein [Aliiglaciecola sp. 2_MG-2023]|uniref:SGNH/GDSL hydrolase family protein n=1 Tax=unclassified Aliiglaciecola TaxID=2593648 RepID=UPI0026E3DE85|nr:MULTISPECIES: SGNH/GDSL hydrolase family protein [unclassified Aliiglaciecola]MDO6712204.1 GDSL-type esterase/lipase family protein [Aliiglaciecola sp. 2_MG-2023]MDO6753558.1 GDSL-type esterase/lipase family protein [Aliiglaciecola sp. 1_MG-2023]